MPYRSEDEALLLRHAALERELAEVRPRVEELRARRLRALPVLDQIHVASPCSARWEDMIGDERVRFCGTCGKNVYDLSTMPRAEAARLIAETEKPCVRFSRRHDGTVLTSDCPVGKKRKRRRKLAAALVGGSLVAGSALVTRRAPERAPCTVVREVATNQPGIEAITMGQMVPREQERPKTPPKATRKHSKGTTMGCLCQPGDPLCSCL